MTTAVTLNVPFDGLIHNPFLDSGYQKIHRGTRTYARYLKRLFTALPLVHFLAALSEGLAVRLVAAFAGAGRFAVAGGGTARDYLTFAAVGRPTQGVGLIAGAIAGGHAPKIRASRLNALCRRMLARAGMPDAWDEHGPTMQGKRDFLTPRALSFNQRTLMCIALHAWAIERGGLTCTLGRRVTVTDLLWLPRREARALGDFLKGYARRVKGGAR